MRREDMTSPPAGVRMSIRVQSQSERDHGRQTRRAHGGGLCLACLANLVRLEAARRLHVGVQ